MRAAENVAGVGFQNPFQRVWGAAACVFIFFFTLVVGPAVVVLTFLTRKGWPADVLGKIWCRGIVKACGIQIDVRGLENIDPSRCYVLLSNHLSNFDIWCTFAALPVKIRFVAKKELLRVPVFGSALAASDHIIIDRSKPQEAIETISREASQQIGAGFCILFYAEGTRSPDGKVHPFKKGGVMLALQTGLPIVPMTVSGTRKFLPKSSIVVRPRGKVRIVLDKPISTEGIPIEERDALNEHVREIVIGNYIEDY